MCEASPKLFGRVQNTVRAICVLSIDSADANFGHARFWTRNAIFTILDTVGHGWTRLDTVGHGWTLFWTRLDTSVQDFGHGPILDTFGHGWTRANM